MMPHSQGATRGVLHHQKRSELLDAEVKDTHDMGMLQVGDGASFATKPFMGSRLHLHMQDFDRGENL